MKVVMVLAWVILSMAGTTDGHKAPPRGHDNGRSGSEPQVSTQNPESFSSPTETSPRYRLSATFQRRVNNRFRFHRPSTESTLTTLASRSAIGQRSTVKPRHNTGSLLQKLIANTRSASPQPTTPQPTPTRKNARRPPVLSDLHFRSTPAPNQYVTLRSKRVNLKAEEKGDIAAEKDILVQRILYLLESIPTPSPSTTTRRPRRNHHARHHPKPDHSASDVDDDDDDDDQNAASHSKGNDDDVTDSGSRSVSVSNDHDVTDSGSHSVSNDHDVTDSGSHSVSNDDDDKDSGSHSVSVSNDHDDTDSGSDNRGDGDDRKSHALSASNFRSANANARRGSGSKSDDSDESRDDDSKSDESRDDDSKSDESRDDDSNDDDEESGGRSAGRTYRLFIRIVYRISSGHATTTITATMLHHLTRPQLMSLIQKIHAEMEKRQAVAVTGSTVRTGSTTHAPRRARTARPSRSMELDRVCCPI